MSFIADYHGRCSECDEPIVPGQRIELVDGDEREYQHADCHARPEKAVCLCEKCWTVHVGACV